MGEEEGVVEVVEGAEAEAEAEEVVVRAVGIISRLNMGWLLGRDGHVVLLSAFVVSTFGWIV